MTQLESGAELDDSSCVNFPLAMSDQKSSQYSQNVTAPHFQGNTYSL